MTEVAVTELEPWHYGVEVSEGASTTNHRVEVPPALLDDLGLLDADPARVVDESIAFLLEREPAASILPEFSLEDIPRYFPEYYDELRSRLAG